MCASFATLFSTLPRTLFNTSRETTSGQLRVERPTPGHFQLQWKSRLVLVMISDRTSTTSPGCNHQLERSEGAGGVRALHGNNKTVASAAPITSTALPERRNRSRVSNPVATWQHLARRSGASELQHARCPKSCYPDAKGSLLLRL